MIPPQVHISLDLLFTAGNIPTNTVGLPGSQGAAVTGIQGIGVKTPKAATVAAATVGLAGDLHITKGRILSKGLLSIILAIGMVAKVLLIGNTISTEGAIPKLHFNIAPPHTIKPIILLPPDDYIIFSGFSVLRPPYILLYNIMELYKSIIKKIITEMTDVLYLLFVRILRKYNT